MQKEQSGKVGNRQKHATKLSSLQQINQAQSCNSGKIQISVSQNATFLVISTEIKIKH